MSCTFRKSLVRRVEALEYTTRKAAPQKANPLLEMSITAMALAWTPDEVDEMLAAAERSLLDELPPELCRRWARCLDRISLQCFGKTFGALLAVCRPTPEAACEALEFSRR
jgi:hypothetical protein